MTADATIITLFFAAESVFTLLATVLLAAQFLHRHIPVQIPSVYWPVAKLSFSPKPNVRRAFRCLFSRWYRKRFWNPLLNAQRQTRGFDRRRHLSSSNVHAASSAMMLTVVAFSLYFAYKAALSGQFQALRTCCLIALGMAGLEMVFNAPAIVLSRYLYLLTLRRPRLNPPAGGNSQAAPQVASEPHRPGVPQPDRWPAAAGGKR
jgi:hypothetical protein